MDYICINTYNPMFSIHKCLFLILTVITSCIYCNAAVSFTGNTRPVITERPPASTGLDDLYVLYETNRVSVQYTSSGSSPVKWYRFSSLGGGYAEEVPSSQEGQISTLSYLQGNMGYIVEDGSYRYYFWVVSYSSYRLYLSSLTISPDSDCASTVLIPSSSGEKIVYYSINGAPQTLSRDIELSYNTLVWDAEMSLFRQKENVVSYPYISSPIHAPAPLCNTEFTLTGDRFLQIWGEEVSVTSKIDESIAVSAETSAVQTVREYDNEKNDGNGSALGGSAPCEIEFSATTTDAAIYREWQFSTDPDFVNLTDRYNDADVTYTFRNQGTTYVRFMASNAYGLCDWYSETYQINIGESALECPNAFSPGSTEGINDEWKVSYKSIISFECQIFNRWGQKIAELTDPSQGWDGRYHGKLVPAGVYYYVIRAIGSDGKEYKLNGDINIINFKDNRRTTSQSR